MQTHSAHPPGRPKSRSAAERPRQLQPRAQHAAPPVDQARERALQAKFDAAGPRPSPVIQRLVANYSPNASDTVITEPDGTVTKRKESDGVVATVAPGDYDKGSVTTAAVRPISQAATRAFGVSFIAGHMLNKHLGGPGNDQKNITAITSRQNSQHHSNLEKAAKEAVKPGGKTITYTTKIIERATFELDPGGGKKKSTAVNLASKLQGSFESTDHTLGAKTEFDLGPPNAKKTGGTARDESKVDASEEHAIAQANALINQMEDSGHVIGDLDDLRELVISSFLKQAKIETIIKAAVSAGYLKG